MAGLLPFCLKENLYCSTIYILYFYFLLAVGTKTLYYGTNVPSRRCLVRGIGRVFMSCSMPSCEDYMLLFHVCEPKCIVVFAVVVNHRDPTRQCIVVHLCLLLQSNMHGKVHPEKVTACMSTKVEWYYILLTFFGSTRVDLGG